MSNMLLLNTIGLLINLLSLEDLGPDCPGALSIYALSRRGIFRDFEWNVLTHFM